MVADLALIKKLPSFITEMFNNDVDKLLNCISIVDEAITNGIVYKVLLDDKLDSVGHESFLLYLPSGSSLKKNVDGDYIDYMVLDGDLELGGRKLKKGDTLEIGPVVKNTIIYVYRYVKVKKWLKIVKRESIDLMLL